MKISPKSTPEIFQIFRVFSAFFLCVSMDWDWVPACRKVEVAGVKCRGGIGRLGKNVWMMT